MSLDVVIMAAGKGTRMKSARPKVLHPLAGRPLLQHVLETGIGLGAERLITVTGHGAEQVEQAMRRALIEKFEGLRLTAYQDMVGVWTIGYGHTGPDVKAGLTITQQQAEQLLINDLARFNNGVNALVTVKINQNQFDALISFSYNLGLGSLQQSTLLRLLNAGNFQAAADQFPRWDRAGGKEVAGLLARRNAERALFLTPD